MIRFFTILLLVSALSLWAVAAELRDHSFEVRQNITPEKERYYLPPVKWLRFFSLGFTEAAADLVWVKGLIYFGTVHSHEYRKAHNLMGKMNSGKGFDSFTTHYIDVATTLNPRFHGAYQKGGKLSLYHRGAITRASVLKAIEIVSRGLKYFPNDGELAFDLGFLYFHEAPSYAKNEKERQSFLNHGIRWIRKASTMQGAPSYAGVLSTTLLKNGAAVDIVIEHLKSLLVKETNPHIRANLENQLQRALGRAAIKDIRLARKMQRKWIEEMPYTDYDLFLYLNSFDIDNDIALYKSNRKL